MDAIHQKASLTAGSNARAGLMSHFLNEPASFLFTFLAGSFGCVQFSIQNFLLEVMPV